VEDSGKGLARDQVKVDLELIKVDLGPVRVDLVRDQVKVHLVQDQVKVHSVRDQVRAGLDKIHLAKVDLVRVLHLDDNIFDRLMQENRL
jgi:hypothetical protein